MSANQDAPYKKEMDTLTQYFEKAKDNQTLLIQIGEDPIGTLQAMGIAVEDKFNEPVKMQLQTASGKTANQATAREAERMSAEVRKIKDTVPAAPAAPTGLRIVQEAVPPNVPNALEFLLKPWGLVLVVREPAINYLQGGGVMVRHLIMPGGVDEARDVLTFLAELDRSLPIRIMSTTSSMSRLALMRPSPYLRMSLLTTL